MSEEKSEEKSEREKRARQAQSIADEVKRKALIGHKNSPYGRNPATQSKDTFSGNAPSGGEQYR